MQMTLQEKSDALRREYFALAYDDVEVLAHDEAEEKADNER